MCHVLDKLEAITPNLPQIPMLDTIKSNCKNKNCKFEDGIVTSKNIYSINNVGISKTFIPKTTIYQPNIYNIQEWIIVIEGCINVEIKEDKTILHRYDSIRIDLNNPHFIIAEEDTTIITITIPKNDRLSE